MTDFSKILDKAKELEAQMKKSQEKIKNIEVEGISGANSVKVLIVAAYNNAKVQLKSKTSEEISKATSAFGIPGFKWPI